MPVEDAVRTDLTAMPAQLHGSALAETALALARELDNPGNCATSKSMCARALTETLDKLRVMAADMDEGVDLLDDLASRRARRLDGKPKAARRSRS